MSPVLDAIGVPDPARSSPAAFPGVVAAGRLSRQAAFCWLAGTRGDGCLRGLLRHDRRARGPPFSFPLISGRRKRWERKGISMTDVADVVSVVTEPVLLPSGGTALDGEPGQRRCKRPGCGNLVPVSGRGRTRVFCGDACSRRFHNAARAAGGDAGAVPPGQAADPLGVLEALIRQAGSLVALARGQVAALDAEVVAAQLAEAEAARRRAEARAVTAEARAAEAGQEMLAALEAAEAAYHGREAAETEARCAREEAARARRELAEEVARARAAAEAAVACADRQAAEAAGIAETARAERDQAGETVRAAGIELARARQGEADAREQARQAREDAAREREALDGQYQARLEAAGQLAAAERDRALRAEQRLDAERGRHDGLLAVLTSADGEDARPAAGGPGGPAARRPGARGTAGNTS
jgi:hypothetical protein